MELPVISTHVSIWVRENSIEFIYYPSDYRHFTQVPSPFCIPQYITLSEPAHTTPELPVLSCRWARAQVINSGPPKSVPELEVPACTEGTFCGESEGGLGTRRQVMGSGCPREGKSWVATTGCAILGGACFSLPCQARGTPGAKTGTAGDGWDH